MRHLPVLPSPINANHFTFIKGVSLLFTIFVVVIVLIGVIAIVGTLVAGRQVENTIETLDQLPQEEQEKYLKTHHFSDPQKNLGVLTWIYVVTFAVSIIAAAIYMIYFR